MPAAVFTREQIYEIRALARAGHSAPQIVQRLALTCATETVRRVIRRETFKEIGLGATERPLVSNRLQGEARAAGDPARPDTPDFEREAGLALEAFLANGPAGHARAGVPPPIGEVPALAPLDPLEILARKTAEARAEAASREVTAGANALLAAIRGGEGQA